jgi:hypothetical protein
VLRPIEQLLTAVKDLLRYSMMTLRKNMEVGVDYVVVAIDIDRCIITDNLVSLLIDW